MAQRAGARRPCRAIWGRAYSAARSGRRAALCAPPCAPRSAANRDRRRRAPCGRHRPAPRRCGPIVPPACRARHRAENRTAAREAPSACRYRPGRPRRPSRSGRPGPNRTASPAALIPRRRSGVETAGTRREPYRVRPHGRSRACRFQAVRAAGAHSVDSAPATPRTGSEALHPAPPSAFRRFREIGRPRGRSARRARNHDPGKDAYRSRAPRSPIRSAPPHRQDRAHTP